VADVVAAGDIGKRRGAQWLRAAGAVSA